MNDKDTDLIARQYEGESARYVAEYLKGVIRYLDWLSGQ